MVGNLALLKPNKKYCRLEMELISHSYLIPPVLVLASLEGGPVLSTINFYDDITQHWYCVQELDP